MFELLNVEGIINFRCEIVGYEFPSELEDNWCLLNVGVKQAENEFTSTDAAITTKELDRLYEWFHCLSEFKLPAYANISFLEPCIELRFLKYHEGTVRIAVNLMRELKPDFPIDQFRRESPNWNIVFELSNDDFQLILSGIDGAREKYPKRQGS